MVVVVMCVVGVRGAGGGGEGMLVKDTSRGCLDGRQVGGCGWVGGIGGAGGGVNGCMCKGCLLGQPRQYFTEDGLLDPRVGG